VAQRAYRGRDPRAPMDAAGVLEVLGVLEEHGIEAWLD
jgi:hypothetical protein